MQLKINLTEDQELRNSIKSLVDSQLKSLVRDEVREIIEKEVKRILESENNFVAEIIKREIDRYFKQTQYCQSKGIYLPRLVAIMTDILNEKIQLAMGDRVIKSFLDLCKNDE